MIRWTMAKQKAKIRETFEINRAGIYKRIWIVSCNGQSKIYLSRKEARAAKAAIDKA